MRVINIIQKSPPLSIRVLGYSLIGTVLFFLSLLTGFILFGGKMSSLNAVVNPSQILDVIRFRTISYSFGEDVPQNIRELIRKDINNVEYNGIKRYSESDERGEIHFVSQHEKGKPLMELIFLPVGHMYWIEDQIATDQLGGMQFYAYEKDRSALQLLTSTYGIKEENLTYIEDEKDLSTYLQEEGNVGLLTPDDLLPHLKLLKLDGEYYLDDPSHGALKMSLQYVVNDPAVSQIAQTLSNHLSILANRNYAQNYTSEDILSLRMTGVTAISRNLAIKVNRSGDWAYPAAKIKDFLRGADLTHTSNEVSFVPGCVPEQSLRFCSHPNYMDTLLASGIDIVELTGNHNNDFGAQFSRSTIEAYKEEGIQYFGGGINVEDAAKPLIIEQKGSKLALLGYNYFDTIIGSMALAGENRSGANSYSHEKLKSDIQKARAEGAEVVIVTFQFQECYSYPEHGGLYPPCYRPLRVPDQAGIFRSAVDAGADIVIGTQAHQPQTYEVYKDRLIFYGLGNMFFDQVVWIGTRQGLIVTHYMIDGKHVQTRLDTTYYESDMQPYLSEGDEKRLLLEQLKLAR